MPLQKSRAIVIRKQNLGESDKIITFYTPYFGKVRAVARGVRKSRSRLGGSIELLNYGELVFFERPEKDLHIINSFDILDTFNKMRNSLTKTTYCFYVAELVGLIVSENNANPRIFQLLLQVLQTMSNVDNTELLIHAFELRLLTLAGYKPELDFCVVCNNLINLRDRRVYFIPRLGGIACRKCSAKELDAIELSQGSRALMKRLQSLNVSNINRFRASKRNSSEIRSAISAFIAYHFEGQIKSWQLIDDVTRAC